MRMIRTLTPQDASDEPMTTAIEAHAVTKDYDVAGGPAVQALRGVDLAIQARGDLCLVGAQRRRQEHLARDPDHAVAADPGDGTAWLATTWSGKRQKCAGASGSPFRRWCWTAN